MKKFPCRMCERSFCSAPSLRRHVRVNHEGIKRVFHCQCVCLSSSLFSLCSGDLLFLGLGLAWVSSLCPTPRSARLAVSGRA